MIDNIKRDVALNKMKTVGNGRMTSLPDLSMRKSRRVLTILPSELKRQEPSFRLSESPKFKKKITRTFRPERKSV